MALSDAERTRLTQLVMAEAGNQPYLGKVAVAAVVKNRVASGGYGNGVSGVIAKPKQFEPVSTGAIDKYGPGSAGWDEAQKAVDAAWGGEDPTGGATHFLNKATTKARGDAATNPGGWGTNMADAVQIGAHTFGKADAGRGDGSVRVVDTGPAGTKQRGTLATLGLGDDEAPASTSSSKSGMGGGSDFDVVKALAQLQQTPVTHQGQLATRQLIAETLGLPTTALIPGAQQVPSDQVSKPTLMQEAQAAPVPDQPQPDVPLDQAPAQTIDQPTTGFV